MGAQQKANVSGISAKVISVISEVGDSAPATPSESTCPTRNGFASNTAPSRFRSATIVEAYNDVRSKSPAMTNSASARSDRATEKMGALSADLATRHARGHPGMRPQIKSPVSAQRHQP